MRIILKGLDDTFSDRCRRAPADPHSVENSSNSWPRDRGVFVLFVVFVHECGGIKLSFTHKFDGDTAAM